MRLRFVRACVIVIVASLSPLDSASYLDRAAFNAGPSRAPPCEPEPDAYPPEFTSDTTAKDCGP